MPSSPSIQRLKALTDKPVCVGFGISTPEHAKQVAAAGADGVIIGSRIVKIIEENLGNPEQAKTELTAVSQCREGRHCLRRRGMPRAPFLTCSRPRFQLYYRCWIMFIRSSLPLMLYWQEPGFEQQPCGTPVNMPGTKRMRENCAVRLRKRFEKRS